MAKLMKPLFINGMYNRKGKRIRVNYLKTISYNNIEYPLWINGGIPDNDYPRNENDKYYLYIQVNDWIVMFGYTEYDLEQRAGKEFIDKEWYGGSKGREKYFNENFYNGRSIEEAHSLIKIQVEKEETFVKEHGQNEIIKVKFIKKYFDKSIENYIKARDNNGKFADFIGALCLGELETCDEIASILKKERQEKEQELKRVIAEQKEQEAKEKEQAEELLIEETEKIFLNCGTIKGGDIIIKLANKYGVPIPIRTKGWILNNLVESTITPDGGISYRFWKSKRGKGSQTICSILHNIKVAINNSRFR